MSPPDRFESYTGDADHARVARLAFPILARHLLDDARTSAATTFHRAANSAAWSRDAVSPRARPTACAIIALPREPEAARQAVERMAGVAAAIPLDPIAIVAPDDVPLPARARRVDPPAAAGVVRELRLALASLSSSDAESAVIWPATHANVELETVLALVDALRRHGAKGIVPTQSGRPGLPVVVARDWWGALATSEATTLHDALQSGVPGARELEVPDPATVDGAATSRSEM
jgi:CTP:molybdopterin cytidylyltransferase MocA